MFRIAKKLIPVPSQVTVEIENNLLSVIGAKGKLSQVIPALIEVKKESGKLQIVILKEEKDVRRIVGTFCAHLLNHIRGVSEGFSCTLALVKVGARAQLEGDVLVLNVGYSNPKRYIIPQAVSVRVPAPTEIIIEGTDIQKVNQAAAEIIRIRPPEIYKGTGILKKGQRIKLKVAKKK